MRLDPIAPRQSRSASTRVRLPLQNQWAGLIALFLVLSSGTAYALSGSNTVFSDDIVDGQIANADLAVNSVGTGKVIDGTLVGADIKSNSITGGDVRLDSLLADDLASAAVKAPELAQLSVRSVNEASFDADPDDERFDTAQGHALCADDAQVISGGAEWQSGNGPVGSNLDLSLQRSVMDGNGWRAVGANDTGGDYVLYVYAYCLPA